ncbi:methyl-accepting chemotaxis protein [uncultured Paludibaculum sp.]|uniref:methyl-accepting chemotaxis protein n=1 Tax=uncultured Paludibaculum sp. TaxID=1765020 RepID=UPI002AAC28D3|nr:methyl-accepting chemotaxis protein [uncultured Paludibaculum sp.]
MPQKLSVVRSGGRLGTAYRRLWSNLGLSFRRQGPRMPAAETAALVRDVDADLTAFNHSTEEVFLPVGRRLMEIQSMARSVAMKLAEMARHLSNNESSIASLDCVLSAAQRDGAGDRIAGWVQGIRCDAKALGSTIDAFGPLVHTFDVLAVMTRIESARFVGEEGRFVGLAASVLELSQQIRQQVGTSAASVAILLQTASEAAAEAGAAARRREENLGPLTEQTSAGLRKIKEHRKEVASVNAQLASRFEGVSAAVGDLVTALQSQDIVRQQVEHVQQALRALHGGTGGRGELPAVARLQAAQLDNSRATLAETVQQIRGSLARIEGNVTEVAGEAACLLGASGQSEPAFFDSVKSNLEGSLDLLCSNRDSERRLASTAVTVHKRVCEIAETISGIRAVGVMMQRIALNATIQAARLGEEGASMEIVANAIQWLAGEAEQASEKTETLLQRIRERATSLETTTESFGTTEAEIARLRHDTTALHDAEALARSGYRQSMELIEGLKQRLQRTVAEFGTQDETLGILDRASGVLRGLGADAQSCDLGSTDVVPASYTMHSERSIHAAFQAGRSTNEADRLRGVRENAAEDNIEFF